MYAAQNLRDTMLYYTRAFYIYVCVSVCLFHAALDRRRIIGCHFVLRRAAPYGTHALVAIVVCDNVDVDSLVVAVVRIPLTVPFHVNH